MVPAETVGPVTGTQFGVNLFCREMPARPPASKPRQIRDRTGAQGFLKNAKFVHIGPSFIALAVVGSQGLGVNADLIQPPAEMVPPQVVADLPAVHVKAESFQLVPAKGQKEPAAGNDLSAVPGIRLQNTGVSVEEPQAEVLSRPEKVSEEVVGGVKLPGADSKDGKGNFAGGLVQLPPEG